MISGRCNCGSIQFEFDYSPDGVYVCHCSICRRSTGGNGIAVVLVPNEHFRWTQGREHIVAWKKAGSDWETRFCRRCGSRVPGQNDPARVFVPAGLLPGHGNALRVLHHIWVGSKAEWDEIGDDGKQHLEGYGE